MVDSISLRRTILGLGTGLIILVSLITHGTMPLSWLEAHVVRLIGALLLFISVGLALAIHRSYPDRHDRPSDIPKLYTKGPYSLCRHPYYFFSMLAQCSVPVYLQSMAGLSIAIATFPVWYYLTMVEERELLAYWGELYLEYSRRTPRLIPRPKIGWKKRF